VLILQELQEQSAYKKVTLSELRILKELKGQRGEELQGAGMVSDVAIIGELPRGGSNRNVEYRQIGRQYANPFGIGFTSGAL